MAAQINYMRVSIAFPKIMLAAEVTSHWKGVGLLRFERSMYTRPAWDTRNARMTGQIIPITVQCVSMYTLTIMKLLIILFEVFITSRSAMPRPKV